MPSALWRGLASGAVLLERGVDGLLERGAGGLLSAARAVYWSVARAFARSSVAITTFTPPKVV